MKLEMKNMSIYFKEILLSLSNMFWGSLPWKGLFWMGQSVSSVAQWCLTRCNHMDCSTLGFPVHHQLLDARQTHVHWLSDAIQPSHSLSSPVLPPSIFPSIRMLSNKLVLRIRWQKYWSFRFTSVLPMNIQDLFPLYWLVDSPCSVFHKELPTYIWWPFEK